MVGVPTSRGCALCLKRRVKCDEERPSCATCRRGGRRCPGYAREMKFVNEVTKVRRSAVQKNKKKRLVKKTLANVGVFSPTSIAEEESSLIIKNDADYRAAFYLIQNQRGTGLIQFDSPQLERTQMLLSFVSTIFPLGVASVQKSFLGSWLWHLPSRLGSSVAFDSASLSVALAYFSRVSGDQSVFRKAELMYMMALRNLAKAIADTTKQFSAEVLCATLLLGHYETFANTSHSWILHAGGAARLMQLRGARRCYESAFEYSMFLTCRGAIISEALASGETCFLDTQDWRSIPDGLIDFPLLPERSELYHEIFGYFASIPGLVRKVKTATNDTRLSLAHAAETLQQRLRQWYYTYTSCDDGRRNPSFINTALSDYYPFSFSYVYEDTMTACVITTYFAYLIILNRQIECLYSDSRFVDENSMLACSISMSVDYCSKAGYCGVQSMRFALPIADSALPPHYHAWTASWIEWFQGAFGGHGN